jgi:hypothetical protein
MLRASKSAAVTSMPCKPVATQDGQFNRCTLRPPEGRQPHGVATLPRKVLRQSPHGATMVRMVARPRVVLLCPLVAVLGGCGGGRGPVVDAPADRSADVPAVPDAAPPANDAPADASLAADAPPGAPSTDAYPDVVVLQGGFTATGTRASSRRISACASSMVSGSLTGGTATTAVHHAHGVSQLFAISQLRPSRAARRRD